MRTRIAAVGPGAWSVPPAADLAHGRIRGKIQNCRRTARGIPVGAARGEIGRGNSEGLCRRLPKLGGRGAELEFDRPLTSVGQRFS
jgi:hypothetical protein